MMSEPLRPPIPPHAMGNEGKASSKRKLDDFGDANDGPSVASSSQQAGTVKKKAKTANGLPKGFQTRQTSRPPDASRSQSFSQEPPNLSHLPPPPARHPVHSINPDDRPLPAPREPLWTSSTSTVPSSFATVGRNKPPSRDSRAGSNPPAQARGGPRQPDRQRLPPIIDEDTTPEDLEKLEELREEIDQIESRQSRPPSRAESKDPEAVRLVPQRTPPNKARPLPPTSRTGLHASTSAVPVPVSETPVIARNRDVRKEQGERRRSSIGQASMRVSESFDQGILAKPHPSVESTKFYEHISAELPEALRIRQLLVWCADRAVPTPSASKPRLPALSAANQKALRSLQDDFMKDLCLGKIDTSVTLERDAAGNKRKKVKEHPRNVVNRKQEATFLKQEADYNAEEAAWSATIQALNSRQASVITSLEDRRRRHQALDEEVRSQIRRDLKGKQRASVGPSQLELDPEEEAEAFVMSKMWDIPPELYTHRGNSKIAETLRLVEEELSRSKNGVPDPEENSIAKRLEDLEPLLDDIHAGAHAAAVLSSSAKLHLDAFSRILASRFRSRTHRSPQGPLNGSLPQTRVSSSTSRLDLAEPFVGLRVLSTAKPVEADVGQSDAAKRVAKNLERGIIERKLTAIPATPNSRRTPRKSVGRSGK